ncbi:MAG: 50S ribosomal protein L11 methyltransferase [Chitinophagales bacterium]
MKNYKIVTFTDTQAKNEMLIAILSTIGFDSFEEKDEDTLVGYVEQDTFDKKILSSALMTIPIFNTLRYEVSDLENKNWNEEWESNFQPIIIDDKCTVRAPFHPPSTTAYTIDIEPRMAFGTGHHATTFMMISHMLNLDFNEKEILDFGTGTGILSILAEKMGAKSIFANDVEEPAVENTIINASLNDCDNIETALGGVEVVPKKRYNIVLANVNTLAIEENLSSLETKVEANGLIMLSGILTKHKHRILDLASNLKFTLVAEKEKDNWVALLYQK